MVPVLNVPIKGVPSPPLRLISNHHREGDEAENHAANPQPDLRLPHHRLPLRPPENTQYNPRPPLAGGAVRRIRLGLLRRGSRRRGLRRHAHLLPEVGVGRRGRGGGWRQGQGLAQGHPLDGRREGLSRRVVRWGRRSRRSAVRLHGRQGSELMRSWTSGLFVVFSFINQSCVFYFIIFCCCY